MSSPPDQDPSRPEWSRGPRRPIPETCAHRLFEEQVARSPEGVAVAFGGDSLTYAELNHRANQLARHLRGLDVGPETLVGLSMPRSIELIVGVLGILKAGGAYVPIDPTYPAARISHMFEDTQLPVIVTTSALYDQLPIQWARGVCLDADQELISSERADDLEGAPDPGNLAYVIYTSGSTGRPKGSQLHHRGLCNMALAQIQAFGLTPASRVLQFSSISFDASVSELFTSLLVGATLVLATRDELLPGPDLVRVLRDQAITCATLPPTVLAALPEVDLPALETIVSAGEACSAELVRRWSGGRRFVNGYGPTETTICATVARCERGEHPPPIGRPIENVSAYVLDERLQQVPVGVPGELHVGGVGLARGYLRRPELTAAAFVPDPYGGEPGARLYRTGDRARFLPDGTLDFLGRIDEGQVKLRGFRIELGEIEAVLVRHPAVQAAAVAPHTNPRGELHLVAYVVLRPDATATVAGLRGALKKSLPEFMVPSFFVVLAALPVTPSGKLDRSALPAPEVLAPGRESISPRTPAEEILAELLAELLGQPRVGVTDDFFERGGYSILAMDFIARLRGLFGMELPIRHFFEAPTVAALAARIEARRGVGGGEVPLRPAPRDTWLPLSPAQEEVWRAARATPGAPVFQRVRVLELEGALKLPALERALRTLLERHEVLRASIALVDGRPMQRVSPVREPVLTVIELGGLSEAGREEAVRRCIEEEATRPFDPSCEPLLRSRLLPLGGDRHLLLCAMHHLWADGGSRSLFTRELTELYAAFAADQPAPLPTLPVDYPGYAVWQRERLEGSGLTRQLDYWRRQLRGPLPVLPLGAQHPRGPGWAAVESIELTEGLAAELQALGSREGVTLFMAVLASFQLVLSARTGQQDVIVCSDVTRRPPGTEALLGCFSSTLPFRTDLSGDPAGRELLRRVREVCLGAYDHPDVPLDELLQAAGAGGWRNRVMLTVGPPEDGIPESPDLRVRPSPLDPRRMQQALHLIVTRVGAGMRLSLEYDSARFEPEDGRELLNTLRGLLERLTAAPEQRLSVLTRGLEAAAARAADAGGPRG